MYRIPVTKDSTVAAKANVNSVLYYTYYIVLYVCIIRPYYTSVYGFPACPVARTIIVPSKRQVPLGVKHIKLRKGIGNGGNGVLIRSTAIL